MRSLAQTSSALDSLAALLPDEAERVEGDDIFTVAPSDLRLGDVVIVRPGGSVPADGDDTALAGIQRLVTEAQNSTSRAQRLADTAAGWLFWFALGAAVITAVVWGVLGRPDEAV